jgi:6-phosphofructokinase 1
VVGGGPAPGTNAAIAATVIEAVKLGCAPIGLHDGFHFLAQRYTDEQHEMTIEEVSRAHLAGGVMLGASRTDVGADTALLRNAVDALRKLAIDALVAIGGDDLVRSVWAVDQESGGRIRAVLLPKSIDNDLAIPSHVPTLGFETARHVGVQLVKNLMEGRPHLRTLVPDRDHGTADRPPDAGNRQGGQRHMHGHSGGVRRRVREARRRRRHRRREHHQAPAMGKCTAWPILSEALVERFDPWEVAELEDVDRDAQGNIRVTEVDLGRKVINEVTLRLERRGIKVSVVDKTIGYELRCAPAASHGSRVCA